MVEVFTRLGELGMMVQTEMQLLSRQVALGD